VAGRLFQCLIEKGHHFSVCTFSPQLTVAWLLVLRNVESSRLFLLVGDLSFAALANWKTVRSLPGESGESFLSFCLIQSLTRASGNV
jgi:hypothetical protein